MRIRTVFLAATMLAAGLAGCENDADPPSPSAVARVPAANTPAAALRADLVGLLEEQLFLTARSTPSGGLPVAAMTANVNELSLALNEAHRGIGDPIPELWSRLLGFDVTTAEDLVAPPLLLGGGEAAVDEVVELFDVIPVDENQLAAAATAFHDDLADGDLVAAVTEGGSGERLGSVLAAALVGARPLDYTTSTQTRAADLRVALTSILRATPYVAMPGPQAPSPDAPIEAGPKPSEVLGERLDAALDQWNDIPGGEIDATWTPYLEALHQGDVSDAGRRAAAVALATTDPDIDAAAVEIALVEVEARLRDARLAAEVQDKPRLTRSLRDAADLLGGLARFLAVAVVDDPLNPQGQRTEG